MKHSKQLKVWHALIDRKMTLDEARHVLKLKHRSGLYPRLWSTTKKLMQSHTLKPKE